MAGSLTKSIREIPAITSHLSHADSSIITRYADGFDGRLSMKLGSLEPSVADPTSFVMAFMVGLVLILATTWIVDKLGTAMYKRGMAKPFYLRGRRIHHSVIYFIVPACYTTLFAMFILGFIQVFWDSLWVRFAYTFILLAFAIAADFLGDRFWPQIRKNAILHHEWIYMVLPVFIFTNVVKVVL